MEIKCWGSRGSIAVSGKDTVKYGGDTTCIEVVAKSGETIIVDAGTGIRRLGKSCIKRKIKNYTLIFTHAHWDHILGFAFFRPLLYSWATVNIQDRKFADIRTKDVLCEVMKEPFFPIGLGGLNANITFDKGLNGKFDIGSIRVEPIPTSHPGGGFGYKFTEDGRSFVFLTDNELGFDHPGGAGFDGYVDFCREAEVLFHDGEYTEEEYRRRKMWGHSAITHVADLAVKAGVKRLGIIHLNQDRTDDQIDQMIAQCRAGLKQQNPAIDCFAVGTDLTLTL